MFRFGKIAVALFVLVALSPRGEAAPDRATDARDVEFELVVVEAQGCIYCPVFRRDVLPAYQSTPRAASVPLRFADIEAIEAGALALAGPIDSVPTVLVMKGGREVGRLAGYAGRENFFRSLDGLLAGVE
jgi:thioredoxin-related protein